MHYILYTLHTLHVLLDALSPIPPILIIAGLGLAFWSRPRALENLAALAGRPGLQIKPLPAEFNIFPRLPTIEGRHRGRDVRFFGKRNADSLTGSIVVAAKYAGDGGFILHVGDRHAIMDRPLYSFRFFTGGGLQPVITEDADFDQAFFFKATDPVTAKNLFTPEVRWELLDVRREGGLRGRLDIEEGEVRYTLHGRFSNQRHVEILAARLDLVCGLAERVEKGGENIHASLTHPSHPAMNQPLRE